MSASVVALGAAATGFWTRVLAMPGNFATPVFTAAAPWRLVDTRNGTGGITGPLASGSTHSWFAVSTSAYTGVYGVVTVTGWSGDGALILFPSGYTIPSISNINYGGSDVSAIASGFSCAIDQYGYLSVHVAGASTHVIIDIVAEGAN